eukprot:762584-Hanusia_phi.AAC.1
MAEHKPSTDAVNACLTDMYQITMCYAYWKAGRHETPAVFEMFFRKSPFNGQFTLLGGVREVLGLLQSYRFTVEQLSYLKEQMPNADPSFFDWMSCIDCSQVKVWSFHEGSTVFAREPLLRVEGPIAVCQLLETTLLCLVNYSSLVATNAARMRLAAGPDKVLVEMGLRRAQGPDGGLSASRYSHMGGFDASSNVLAGLKFGVKISGTHAHAFVQSFSGIEELQQQHATAADGSSVNLVDKVMHYRKQLGISKANLGELAAFIAYCQVDSFTSPSLVVRLLHLLPLRFPLPSAVLCSLLVVSLLQCFPARRLLAPVFLLLLLVASPPRAVLLRHISHSQTYRLSLALSLPWLTRTTVWSPVRPAEQEEGGRAGRVCRRG